MINSYRFELATNHQIPQMDRPRGVTSRHHPSDQTPTSSLKGLFYGQR